MYIPRKLYYLHENLLSGTDRNGWEMSVQQGCVIFSLINVLLYFPGRKTDKVRSPPHLQCF